MSTSHRLAIAALVPYLAACGGLELNPLTNEARTIRPEQDRARVLTLERSLVLDDKKHAAHELRLPAGVYAFEGEDADYWYMRASAPLTLADFRHGGSAGPRALRGGIAVGKFSFRSVPAAAYIDGEGAGKILIWKLGKDFMRGEGSDWKKSF